MKLYRTRTREQYDWLMKDLEGEGYLYHEILPTKIDLWSEHGELTVIRVERANLFYADKEFYRREFPNESIIEVSELMKEQVKEHIDENTNIPSSVVEFTEDIDSNIWNSPTVAEKERVQTPFDRLNNALPTAEEAGERFASNLGILQKESDNPIEPNHYKSDQGGDLFGDWYDRFYHSDKTYTGRELFIELMKATAERYTRRYPQKNAEDISKAINTLERLREYEEQNND